MDLTDKQWEIVKPYIPEPEQVRTSEKGGRATKIMAVVDRHGLPIAIGIASGQRHETKLVKRALKQRFLRALPRRLIGDMAYDSNPLDADLALMAQLPRSRGKQFLQPNGAEFPVHAP